MSGSPRANHRDTMTDMRFYFVLIGMLVMAACAPDAAQQATIVPPGDEAAQSANGEATSATEPAATASPTMRSAAENVPEPTAAPTEVAPTTAPVETAAPENEEAEVVVNGRTDDGAYFLGRADAPLTIIDYSDFL